MAWTFTMVCVAWVFFRAESLGEAVGFINRAWVNPISWPVGNKIDGALALTALMLIDFSLTRRRLLHNFNKSEMKVIRWAAYLTCMAWILSTDQSKSDFIYFQF